MFYHWAHYLACDNSSVLKKWVEFRSSHLTLFTVPSIQQSKAVLFLDHPRTCSIFHLWRRATIKEQHSYVNAAQYVCRGSGTGSHGRFDRTTRVVLSDWLYLMNPICASTSKYIHWRGARMTMQMRKEDLNSVARQEDHCELLVPNITKQANLALRTCFSSGFGALVLCHRSFWVLCCSNLDVARQKKKQKECSPKSIEQAKSQNESTILSNETRNTKRASVVAQSYERSRWWTPIGMVTCTGWLDAH